MGDKEIRAYIDIINKIKPKMILAYSQSIYELARYVESNRLQVYSPHSILSSATPLSSNNRNTIERVFNCQVYNRYGSREVGSIASECYKHEGLHVSILTHYIEILNDKLEMCKEGEKGEIYVTLLTNYTMPLIRYKIQDMAIFTNKPCSCGRGLPLIIDVMGRTSEYFLKRDGTKVDGYFFDFPIWDKNWLLRYQIIQKGYNLLVYNLKVQYEPPRGELEEIDNKIKKVMGNDCKIIFNFVDNIVPSVSGKYKQFIRDF